MDELPEGTIPGNITRAAAGLRKLGHVPAPHADLFERLASVQEQARASLKPPVYPPLAAETAARMLRHGFYLIDFARLKMDPEGLRRLAGDLAVVLSGLGQLSEPQTQRLGRALETGKLSLPELAGAVFRGEADYPRQLARRVHLPQRLLTWLATLLLKPFLSQAAAELAPHLDGLTWPYPYCPVCGHEPFMAVVRRQTGRLEVACSLCATHWQARRGRCVLCANEDKQTYQFLYYDLESPYRVDVCGKCRRYIKVVDERKIPRDREVVLLAEDVATLYLDKLARRRGYQPPWSPGAVGKAPHKPDEEEVMLPKAEVLT
jgi:FdhE protein